MDKSKLLDLVLKRLLDEEVSVDDEGSWKQVVEVEDIHKVIKIVKEECIDYNDQESDKIKK